MFDKIRLQEVLSQYKKDFVIKQWDNEKYKWEAIKCFQDNWDVNADDFADMLKRSLAKTSNLLSSMNNFPAKMITGFAEEAPEEIRSMYIALFDESKDLYERINGFKTQAETFLKNITTRDIQHYQNENAVSVYLWLRYPDNYYIYKYGEVKTTAKVLESNYSFKKGGYADNLRNFYKFYDEICAELQQDEELIKLLESHLTEDCYPDPKLRTLTGDVGFYISRVYSKKDTSTITPEEWIPAEYVSPLTKEDWLELLADSEVFNTSSLEIMKRLKDYGGAATCTQLSVRYGETKNFYNKGASSLAERIASKKRLKIVEIHPGEERWWPILFTGKQAGKDEEGSFIWKLRDELSEALNETDLNDVDLYVQEVPGDKTAIEPYSKKDFLEEVFMTEQKYDRLVSVLRNKKNIILQGAPGVGKTFTAKRLAYSMMNVKDDNRIEFVQFHQNYTYEDFVMGYKPVEDGFDLKFGIFYRFCQKASNHPEKDYFFIIDEINRGNLSKIFGELLMLIERDYRDTQVTLAYNDRKFSVPSNLYIIGMMNTADRSLAMIDYALRRRFSFIEMEPGFDTEGFIQYQKRLNSETFDELILKIKDLNTEIARDRSLGKGFCIGHSYFCQKDVCTDEWLKEVVDYDILPMLSEYWFDDADKLIRWENILHGIFQ